MAKYLLVVQSCVYKWAINQYPVQTTPIVTHQIRDGMFTKVH
jgi:hypothetical protein